MLGDSRRAPTWALTALLCAAWPACGRGGEGSGSAGEGTVGVARDGGGISVIKGSGAPGSAGVGERMSAASVGAAPAGAAWPAGAALGIATVLGMPLGRLGVPAGTVCGERESLGDAGRMLGGGRRRPAEPTAGWGGAARMLGGAGRMLGGSGRALVAESACGAGLVSDAAGGW